jgi:hypothetical protein
MLMYYLDIAEVIKQHDGNIDWETVIQLARETGTLDVFGSVLSVCHTLLTAPIPTQVLEALPVNGGGPITRWAMNMVLDREVTQYLGLPPNRFWDAMVITNGAFILRPIRLVESAPYFFPSSEFLKRKYGRDGFVIGTKHFARAVAQFTRFGWDSVNFGVERHRRLKGIGYSTSLFNKLETGE